MKTLDDYKQKIFIETAKLNAHPSKEGLDDVEGMIDFYSDWYKDEHGVRPRADIGAFREAYTQEIRDALKLLWGC